MGQYRIVIEGVGTHHNAPGRTDLVDADKAAGALVDELKKNGHSITKAEFVMRPEELNAHSPCNINYLAPK